MPSHGQSTTQPPAPERAAAWVAVVPVKPLRAAKTRLRGAVPEAVHPDLVLAMARDTVAAALACRAVARAVVICDDPAVCEELTALGAFCLPDAPAAGLNAALAYGAQVVGRLTGTDGRADAGPAHAGDGERRDRRFPWQPQGDQANRLADSAAGGRPGIGAEPGSGAWPGRSGSGAAAETSGTRNGAAAQTGGTRSGRAGSGAEGRRAGGGAESGRRGGGVEAEDRGAWPPGLGVVALTADLPAMRPQDLEAALGAAARAGRRAFVPDLEGTGTVLLAAPAGMVLAPQFGPGSAVAHLRSGAVHLDGDWPSLRRDVDTAADLDAAARLGLGAHTGRVLCTVA